MIQVGKTYISSFDPSNYAIVTEVNANGDISFNYNGTHASILLKNDFITNYKVFKYKIGDKVIIKNGFNNYNSEYIITEMPNPQNLFSDHYRGQEVISKRYGMFPESNIITLNINFDEMDKILSEFTGIKTIIKSPGKKPVVTKNEQVCYFDVDETLVKWMNHKTQFPGYLKADYYGEEVILVPYEPHIRFLKAMKARGGHIVVQSGNGWAWAEQVVGLLKLEAFVDEIKTKPYKIVDDSDYENWMPTRIFIQE